MVTTMNDYITGYKASKMVNEVLDANNIKNIPPQMVYNYISKGYIKSEVVNNQRVVHINDVAEWCDKYITKKRSKLNS